MKVIVSNKHTLLLLLISYFTVGIQVTKSETKGIQTGKNNLNPNSIPNNIECNPRTFCSVLIWFRTMICVT